MINLETTISLKDVSENLRNVQGNILIKHGKIHAAHVLLTFNHHEPGNVAEWIKNKIKPRVTSASDQLRDIDPDNFPTSIDHYFGFSLSAKAYNYFGLTPPEDRAFLRNMDGSPLNDPSPKEWDEGYQKPNDIHALISIAHDSKAAIKKLLNEVLTPEVPAEILRIEWGKELPGDKEHFGFVDGISQPLFIDEEIANDIKEKEGKLFWNPKSPLRIILKKDPHGQTENCFGSFLVFRKLGQDVSAFNSDLEDLASHLDVNTDLAGAMIMGRFKDGTPLAVTNKQGLGPLNNFNFEDDKSGSKCPFHSHIRKVNPRGEHNAGAETPDLENRIARRSIPYGNAGDEDVGMLFMCYQSNLVRQFELIQINWSNFGDFGRLKVGVDPVTGYGNSWEQGKPQKWPTEWGEPTFSEYLLKSNVEMRGGAYFFTPSISTLEILGSHLH